MHISDSRFQIPPARMPRGANPQFEICDLHLSRRISKICAAGDDDNQSQREWSPSVLVPAAHSKKYFPRIALQMRVLSDGLFRKVGTFPTDRDT